MSISEYVKKLGGSEELVKKIELLKSLGTSLCPEKIDDFFISEYKQQNGKRVLENAWFFSPKYVLESKQIIQKNLNIDLMCIEEFIDRCEIDANNYDFKKAIDESSLTVTTYMGPAVGLLKATGFNCDILLNVVKKYILPNLYKAE